MSDRVVFLLAIPILQQAGPEGFIKPHPVAGVIYVDSQVPDFFVCDNQLRLLVSMTQTFVASLARIADEPFGNIQKPLPAFDAKIPPTEQLPDGVRNVLELTDIEPPKAPGPFQLSFDSSDFVPV